MAWFASQTLYIDIHANKKRYSLKLKESNNRGGREVVVTPARSNAGTTGARCFHPTNRTSVQSQSNEDWQAV